MDRCHLKGAHGDAANAILAAAGYNFRLILKWLKALLRAFFAFALMALSAGQFHAQAA